MSAALDADYKITSVQEGIAREFIDILTIGTEAMTMALMGEGLPEYQAANVAVSKLIDYAAALACMIRRQLLEGEPDPALWRANTDAAFERAVRRAAPPTATAKDQS